MNRHKKNLGFGLIEIIFTIAIIAILVTIAYPSYQEYVIKNRRSDAKFALMNLSNQMERYYVENNTYATATIATGNSATDVLSSTDSPDGYYTLSIPAKTATSYTLKAQRKTGTVQVGDTKCGDLTLTSTGVKGITGTGSADYCW